MKPLLAFLLFLQTPLSTASETHSADVLIVGAGLSGLSTAYYLKKLGLSYEVLELTSHIGGRIRTPSYQHNGETLSAEGGLAEFWDGNPTLKIFQELGVKTHQGGGTFSTHVADGKIVRFTQDSNDEFLKAVFTKDDYKAFREWDEQQKKNLELLQSRKKTPLFTELHETTFDDYLKKSKLSKKVQAFIRTHLEPEFATPSDRISAAEGIADWHIFSGKGLNPNHVIGGNQVGAEAIAKAIGIDHVQLNTQVTRIKNTPTGVEVTTSNTATFKEKVFTAKYVVTTIPLYRLFELHFDPPLPAERMAAISSQTWGAYFTAHVIVDNAAKSFWTKDGESLLTMLTNSPLGVIYPGQQMSEEGRKTQLLNLLVTGDHAEKFNSRMHGLDGVRAELEAELEKLWPGFKKHIVRWNFMRYHPRAIASWPVGRSRFDDLSELMRTPEGRVYFAGDFTEGTHSDGAAWSAIRVSRQIGEREKIQLDSKAPVLLTGRLPEMPVISARVPGSHSPVTTPAAAPASLAPTRPGAH